MCEPLVSGDDRCAGFASDRGVQRVGLVQIRPFRCDRVRDLACGDGGPFVEASRRPALDTTAIDPRTTTGYARYSGGGASRDGVSTMSTEARDAPDAPLDDVPADRRRALVRRVAAADREPNRVVYDALETE